MKNFLAPFLLVIFPSLVCSQQESVFYINVKEDDSTYTLDSDPIFIQGRQEFVDNSFNQIDLTQIDEDVRVTETIENSDQLEQKIDLSSLGEAYYAVGEQYERVGKKEKGEDFKRRAGLIDSTFQSGKVGFDASGISLSSRERAEEQTLSVDQNSTVGSSEVVDESMQERILTLQFNRFARGILSGNQELLARLFDNYIEVNNQPISREDIMAAFSFVYEQSSVLELSYENLYESDLSIQTLPRGGIVSVQALAQSDLSALPFWKKNQSLYFQKKEGLWKIVKIDARD